MNAKQVETEMKGIETNKGLITVYKHNSDGTVSAVYHTFRTDAVKKYLKRKTGKFTVSQKPE